MGVISTLFIFIIIAGSALVTVLLVVWGVTTGAIMTGVLTIVFAALTLLGFLGVRTTS